MVKEGNGAEIQATGAVAQRLEAVLRRAAIGLLACPYCQSALVANKLTTRSVQLVCPTCGFTELPDLFRSSGEPD